MTSTMRRLTMAALVTVGTAISPILGAQADDLRVLGADASQPPAKMVYRYLQARAEQAFEQRAQGYEKLKTAEDVAAWGEARKTFFAEQIGGWPERTPLNARVTGRGEFDDYRIEKIVFESRPDFFVTGVLFLPKTEPPYPGVLVPCGHSDIGKAYEAYQRASILLAKNGLAAFCFDPIGQGERSQFLTDKGTSAFGSTLQHTQVGTGCILLGTNAAGYFIWDGMRAIDYLQSRPDIDGKRIGCTGNSGGGMQTAYLMALDERIVAAAPSCFLTTLPRLVDSQGPQDAEQNIQGAIAFGMGHADYILMRAPKPTLMCTATRDFFDILGAWETFREAKRIYTRIGHGESVDLVETDEQHGFSTWLRVGATRWMRRWLLHRDDAIMEPDFPILSVEELTCTPRGQVLFMDGARSAIDLNVELDKKLAPQRRTFWQQTAPAEAKARVRELAGIRSLADLPGPAVEKAGTVERDGYRIEKWVIRPEEGIELPGLWFTPDQVGEGLCLYLHGESKAVDAGVGGPIEALVKQGRSVLAVDLRGIGETRAVGRHRSWVPQFGEDWQDYFLAYLLDRTYVGMRADDALVCARYLKQKMGLPVDLVAIGEATVPALHAAAVEPSLFGKIRLKGGVRSWADVVAGPVTRGQLINTVHGALRVYDLPDLVATLPADRVTIEEPTGADGQPLVGK